MRNRLISEINSTCCIMLLRRKVLTKAEDWPMWLQIAVGVPNAIGLTLAWVWNPKTEKGLICQFAFLVYIFLFVVLFVWQSLLGYLVMGVICLGIGIALFLRLSKTEHWPNRATP